MKSKIMFTSLLATALIVPGHASAQCTISSARLQQISEREILAIIDGKCTKENGESGYYTQIAPDTYGEVMAVYGHRNIDQYGIGWKSDYGYNIVFQNTQDSYSAGVWIADVEGVVHSEVMTIANQFATTTTSSSTTVPSNPSIPAQQVRQVLQQPTAVQETIQDISPSQIIEVVLDSAAVPATTTTSTTIPIEIIKYSPIKKAVPKCLSRQKLCKLRVVGATKITGQK
jgi:hypothetical protein